ncbi:ribosome biogenesis GTPase YqeH [Turicibacter sp. 1E2]|uniref:ribosome biogenesis GTPase YqeH n=1 Tax=unclassified Turicibacter TaxID=2638206 RepID=UPI00137AB90F|nr:MULTISPECIES: ribosome biogenesis GTPase YqeH [unclassified Turicibacter]MCU7209476.1 ribosome biogenesis GTPase YqeH [Turicibacter sp. 1E2]NCE79075.1 ribosome biogenesis GTPase YqeH [Turicibacter sp. TS3]
MEELKCIGCGATIQTINSKEIGYTPKSSIEKMDRQFIYCQRCFKLKHYNEVQDVSLTSDDFLKILQKVGESDALVINIVDIFDFSGSMVAGISRHINGNDILLVGNKVDLLPKSVNKTKLNHWMRRSLKEIGLKPLDVALVSAAKGLGIDELMEMIEKYRKGRDVYIVGCTNVGKSTLVNRIIKRFTEEREDVITTSHFPGTTLDIIEIPLDEKTSIIDTPGIINEHQLAHYVSPKVLKEITPKKEIKAGVYQLNPQQTLFIGGLARMDFVKGERTSFITHFSNALHIHRTKLEKADCLWKTQAGNVLKPIVETSNGVAPMEKHVYHIGKEKTDLVISGLGWITLMGAGQQITVYAPKGVGVLVRPSLI